MLSLFRTYFEERIIKLVVDPRYYDEAEGLVVKFHFMHFLQDIYDRKYNEYLAKIINQIDINCPESLNNWM